MVFHAFVCCLVYCLFSIFVILISSTTHQFALYVCAILFHILQIIVNSSMLSAFWFSNLSIFQTFFIYIVHFCAISKSSFDILHVRKHIVPSTSWYSAACFNRRLHDRIFHPMKMTKLVRISYNFSQQNENKYVFYSLNFDFFRQHCVKQPKNIWRS